MVALGEQGDQRGIGSPAFRRGAILILRAPSASSSAISLKALRGRF